MAFTTISRSNRTYMTVEDFKKQNPNLSHLEGNSLWDAMEDSMLQQQSAEDVVKQIMPIWKTHTFRWLFYRRIKNRMSTPLKYDKWMAHSRCNHCKWGVNSHIVLLQKDGAIHICPNCGKNYTKEPNTNFSHQVYLIGNRVVKMFWRILDNIHLIRSSVEGRYDTFGDESRYVLSTRYSNKWEFVSRTMRKRKWWEYILIERRRHNF